MPEGSIHSTGTKVRKFVRGDEGADDHDDRIEPVIHQKAHIGIPAKQEEPHQASQQQPDPEQFALKRHAFTQGCLPKTFNVVQP